MTEAKIIITNILKEAYDNDIISKPEYSAGRSREILLNI